MEKILIAYDTVSGSTREMAVLLQSELGKHCQADILLVTDNPSPAGYDAIIIGSPMRFGGFRSPVKKYLRRNRDAFGATRVAYFMSILYIVGIEDDPDPAVAPFIDPSLTFATIKRKNATLFDRKHTLHYYDSLVMKSLSGLRPVAAAYFNGRLVINGLNLFERLFMRVITSVTNKERQGDYFNPEAVRSWASLLGDQLFD